MRRKTTADRRNTAQARAIAPLAPPLQATERRTLWMMGLLGPADTLTLSVPAWQRLRFARWLYVCGRLTETDVR